MKQALVLATWSTLLLASASAAAGADAEQPRVRLSVSPARVALAGPGSRQIRLRNMGAEQVAVDVTQQPVALTWLHTAPARLLLRSGGSGTLTLRVMPPPDAEPGEHHALVLLTTRPPSGGRVNVQLRLGVRVSLRVPGPIVREVILGGLRVRRKGNVRLMFVSVANLGNVTVQLHGRVTATLLRRGRRLARIVPPVRRAVAPGARAVVALRYAGRVRGPVTAVVRVRPGAGSPIVERRYRIRL